MAKWPHFYLLASFPQHEGGRGWWRFGKQKISLSLSYPFFFLYDLLAGIWCVCVCSCPCFLFNVIFCMMDKRGERTVKEGEQQNRLLALFSSFFSPELLFSQFALLLSPHFSYTLPHHYSRYLSVFHIATPYHLQVGSLAALFMAQQGHEVHVYETREGMPVE